MLDCGYTASITESLEVVLGKGFGDVEIEWSSEGYVEIGVMLDERVGDSLVVDLQIDHRVGFNYARGELGQQGGVGYTSNVLETACIHPSLQGSRFDLLHECVLCGGRHSVELVDRALSKLLTREGAARERSVHVSSLPPLLNMLGF